MSAESLGYHDLIGDIELTELLAPVTKTALSAIVIVSLLFSVAPARLFLSGWAPLYL